MNSSSSTQAQERDTHILDIGKQCSHSTCLLVDFLPFKCQHCKLSFCQEHFRVEDHKCPQYDDTKYIVPSCPLCNQPVYIEQGRDPNISMDLHLEKNCSVVTGRVKARTVPVCARGNCQKPLIISMQCSSCKKKFCPTHRHPDDHRCHPTVSTPANNKLNAKPNAPNPFANLNAGAKNFNTKATAAGNAAVDAVKKSINTAAIPAARNALNSVSASSSSSSTPKAPLPFSKMDRYVNVQSTFSSTRSSSTSPSGSPSSNYLDMTHGLHSINTATTASAPTNNDTTNITNETIKPSPIIDSMSFIPRPIFASA
ncbi:hypothetical protein CVT25_012899 [Psilocybe cyanescens]|uniref:AN1-type domain-containing protein n=1 Tax=Psilocybe cyanescens TaxID=93625 RepID=A0A409XLV8_PSICY|nr:hypothetical protein CVT25_012899 [Psilocybe cyanescens]